MLYSTNTFHFESAQHACDFPKTILPKRIPLITSLSLHTNILDRETFIWPAAHLRSAYPNLRRLEVREPLMEDCPTACTEFLNYANNINKILHHMRTGEDTCDFTMVLRPHMLRHAVGPGTLAEGLELSLLAEEERLRQLEIRRSLSNVEWQQVGLDRWISGN